MCQCFQIGGPFIAEDPECPEHGVDAQQRADQFLQADLNDVTFVPEGIQVHTEREGVILIPRSVIQRFIESQGE